ncbi:hypothetical protein D3C71_1297920 [compost metagenome]
MDAALKMKLQQLLQKRRVIVLLLFREVPYILLREPEAVDIIDAPLQTGEHGESVPEWQLAEIGFKHRSPLVRTVHPMGVHHVDLVFIRMQSKLSVQLIHLLSSNAVPYLIKGGKSGSPPLLFQYSMKWLPNARESPRTSGCML